MIKTAVYLFVLTAIDQKLQKS